MRKLLIVTVACSWIMATADAATTLPPYPVPSLIPQIPLNFTIDTSPRPYTQFDFGTTRIINSATQNLPNKMIFSHHVMVGMDFTGSQVGLYFTNFGRYNYKWKSSNDLLDKQVILDISEFGVNYSYAFTPNSKFSPYIGIRTGYTYFRLRRSYSDVYGGYLAQTGEKSHVSIGTFAGIEANISPNFTIGAGIEYGRLHGNDIADFSAKAFTRTYF